MAFTYLCLPTKKSSFVGLQELIHVSEGMSGKHNSLSLTQINYYYIIYSWKVTILLKRTGFMGLVVGKGVRVPLIYLLNSFQSFRTESRKCRQQ